MRIAANYSYVETYSTSRAWRWFIGIGLTLTVLGFVAATDLVMATFAAVFLVGVAMAAGGVLQLLHAFAVRRHGHGVLWGLGGVLYLLAGLAVTYDPLFAATVVTLWLAVLLAFSGVVRVAAGWRLSGSARVWMTLSGLLSLSVALLIGLGWPTSSVWLPGLVLVVDLAVQGIMLTFVGVALRRSAIEQSRGYVV